MKKIVFRWFNGTCDYDVDAMRWEFLKIVGVLDKIPSIKKSYKTEFKAYAGSGTRAAVAGTSTSMLYDTIFPDLNRTTDAAIEDIRQCIPAPTDKESIIILAGFSRGAISANLCAQKLVKMGYGNFVHLIMVDPVPGNTVKAPGTLTWDASNLKNFPIPFCAQIIGNYRNIIPGFDRVIVDTHHSTEQDIHIIKAREHLDPTLIEAGMYYSAYVAVRFLLEDRYNLYPPEKIVIGEITRYSYSLPDSLKSTELPMFSGVHGVYAQDTFNSGKNSILFGLADPQLPPLITRFRMPKLVDFISCYQFIVNLSKATSTALNFILRGKSKGSQLGEMAKQVHELISQYAQAPSTDLDIKAKITTLVNEAYALACKHRWGSGSKTLTGTGKVGAEMLQSPAFRFVKEILDTTTSQAA